MAARTRKIAQDKMTREFRTRYSFSDESALTPAMKPAFALRIRLPAVFNSSVNSSQNRYRPSSSGHFHSPWTINAAQKYGEDQVLCRKRESFASRRAAAAGCPPDNMPP